METIDVREMTLGQVERVELKVGLPVTKWMEAPSMMALYRAILEVVAGMTVEETEAIPVRDLLLSVKLNMDPAGEV